MAVNKVVYGGNTLIDLTADTVAADTLLEGFTAYNSKGEKITGEMTPGLAINGLIEEYKVASGESISAGDFVKFVGSDELQVAVTNTLDSAIGGVASESGSDGATIGVYVPAT